MRWRGSRAGNHVIDCLAGNSLVSMDGFAFDTAPGLYVHRYVLKARAILQSCATMPKLEWLPNTMRNADDEKHRWRKRSTIDLIRITSTLYDLFQGVAPVCKNFFNQNFHDCLSSSICFGGNIR